MNGVNFQTSTYQSKQSISDMTSASAQAIEELLIQKFKPSSFFGIICDESCDVSNFKKLIVYLTYIDEDGYGKTAFVDILNINDGKADTIVNSLKSTMEKLNIDLNKIVGLGTDGAAVMTGCKGGVGVRLKTAGATHLLQIHCSAHRVSLALSQAAKNIKQTKDLENTLQQLYHFFDDSPVRESVLRQIFQINEISEIKLKEPKNVRWLSLYEAVSAVIQCFGSIVEALEHIAEKKNDLNSVKAKGLLSKIKNANFPFLLAIILDVLEPVKKLNVLFQHQNVIFSKVNVMVSSCISVLENLKGNKGEHENNYIENCTNDEDDVVYQNIKLGKQTLNEHFKSNFISEVVGNLKFRFPAESLDVLKSLDSMLNPFNYPTNSEELLNYGSEDIDLLIRTFGELISGDKLKNNFQYFKQIVLNFKSMSMKDFLRIFIKQYSDEFPEFSKLAKIASVLPISSADAERGFSAMKRIKTCARNRISEGKLKTLMMITLEGPDMSNSQDVIIRAHKIFQSCKIRRGGSSVNK